MRISGRNTRRNSRRNSRRNPRRISGRRRKTKKRIYSGGTPVPSISPVRGTETIASARHDAVEALKKFKAAEKKKKKSFLKKKHKRAVEDAWKEYEKSEDHYFKTAWRRGKTKLERQLEMYPYAKHDHNWRNNLEEAIEEIKKVRQNSRWNNLSKDARNDLNTTIQNAENVLAAA